MYLTRNNYKKICHYGQYSEYVERTFAKEFSIGNFWHRVDAYCHLREKRIIVSIVNLTIRMHVSII